MHEALAAGLEAMGLRFLVRPEARLPQLNAIRLPEGLDEAKLRARLLEEYGLEIGAGLGALAGQIVRIGLMGHSANPKNVMYCLGALEAVLRELAAPIEEGVALGAAQRALA
jgi:alanine-glyoxylate transaminase/serine-glyoxylate transaminase/serine-pyruvate transaminase